MHTLTRRERETEHTRQLIVESARTLFAANGYDNVTVRDIAARAGISHGTIYLHFRDKDDLLYQVSEEQFRRLLERLRRLPRNRNIRTRLRAALLEVIRSGLSEPNDYQLMMGFREALGGENGSDQWGPMADQVGAFFDELVNEGVEKKLIQTGDERQVTLMMIAVMDGIVLASIIQGMSEEEAGALAVFTVDRMIAGLSAGDIEEERAETGDV